MPAVEEILLRLSGDPQGAERALKRVQGAIDPLKKKSEDLNKAFKTISITFGAVSAAGAGLIKSTAQVAMRNEVLATSLYAVGKNAGYGREELDVLVDQVKAMGITTSNARLSLTRMIQSQLDLTKAAEMARTAQDLAVISGENSSATYQKIMDATSALQPRYLKEYGIVATLDQILGDLANSNDTVAKRQRFFNFVLEEGAKVSGVYQDAMGVVGKQLTSFPRYIEEAKATFGQHFIPIIGKGAEILKALIQGFQNLPEPVQKFIAQGVLLGTVVSAAVAGIGALGLALPPLIGGFTAAIGVISPILPVLLAIGAALGVLAGAGYVLAKAWKEDWGGIRTAVGEAWAEIKPALAELMGLFREIGAIFGLVGGQVSGTVKSFLEPAFARLAQLIRAVPWTDLVTYLKDAINVAMSVIGGFLKAIQALFRGDGEAAFMALQEAMLNVLTLIALTWEKYIADALSWGYNLVVEAANGIIRAAQTVVVSAMNYLGNIIGNFLAGASPPPEGPLSHLEDWGKGVFETYLQSFSLADFGILEDAMAPIQAALEDALALGAIDESEFVQLFAAAQEEVAHLISVFEETGEISQEILGDIADTLGAGSEELIKYLELQLEYEEALNDLLAVQEEVAAAEEAGFVPADLKAKLDAAEAEADAAYDAMEWQREYLELQEESVDLQLRMVQALEDVAKALDEAAEGTEGLAGGEVEAPEMDLSGLIDPAAADGLGDVSAQLGVMSSEFEAMKKNIKAFLDLPLEGKLQGIFDWLTKTTGIDFAGFWERVQGVLEDIDERGLLTVIAEWAGAGLDYAAEHWPEWADAVGEYMGNALDTAAAYLLGQAEEHALRLIEWLGAVVLGLLDWGENKREEWGATLHVHVTTAMGRLLDLLTSDIPRWVSRLITWLKDTVQGLLDWFLTEAPRYGQELWTIFLVALETWLAQMYENIGEWITNLVTWFGDLLGGLGEELLAQAGELLSFLYDFGVLMVDRIKEGIDDTWWAMLDWVKNLLKDLRDILPGSEPKDPTSPMRNLAEAGRAFAENIASGIDFAPVRAALAVELARTQQALGGGIGDVNIQQTFGDMTFPNVKSGRDALGVRTGIDRRALEAGMMARTGGI